MHIPIKVEIELKEDSKGLRKLVDVTARALGWFGEPLHKFLLSKADASDIVTRAKAEAHAEDIKFVAALRREHLENRRTRNIQAVIQQTIPLLKDEVSEQPVDEDWAIHFFEQVQDVSDAEMQTLWSRILAGEIGEPQSFSIRTLNFLKSLRKREAEDFAEICRAVCTFDGDFPLLLTFADEANKKCWTYSRPYSGIRWHLQNIGLVAADSTIDTPQILKRQVRYFDERYRFTDPNDVLDHKLHMITGFHYLTITGAELYQIASPTKIEGYAAAAVAELAKDLQLGWDRES